MCSTRTLARCYWPIRLLATLAVLALAPSAALAASAPEVRALPGQSPGLILAVGFVVAAEAVLILALVWFGRRRRAIQRRLELRLRFERTLSELAVSTARMRPEAIDEAVDSALSRIAPLLGLDWAWRWDADPAEDVAWDSGPLREGAIARFDGPAALPAVLQRRLAVLGVGTCSAIAVPLVAEDVMSGAVFWVSRDAEASARAEARELQRVAAVVATVLQRRHAEIARAARQRLEGAIPDSPPAHVAALDRDGTGEDRFLSMADALPVAIWVSDADGGCSYFNKEWFQLTGRTLEEERGDGWLESVHADDRAECLAAYRGALQRREGFRIEYRIRRHDGEFRWLLDTAMPRFGSDGAFQGYVGGCVDITERKEAERVLRGLSHRLMQAQDDERRRLSRELHDHLSQQLALLAIDLQQLSSVPAATAAGLVPALDDTWRRTSELASDVHALSHRLHPSKIEALGLLGTIQAHCRDVSKQGLPVRLRHHDVPADIAPERTVSVFRVLEEALSNVIRHSGATEALVTLFGADSHVILRVADSGRGFVMAGESSAGMGLIGMRERLQSLNGSLSVTSAPGHGTVVEARVPVAAVSVDGRAPDWARRAEPA
jgi:PAS domain S-box-containing protein